MSSETEDSDRALKPGPHSNLLHPEKKRAPERRQRKGEGERRVMDTQTEMVEEKHNVMVCTVLHGESQRLLLL